MSDFTIYAKGICFMSVCSSLPPHEVLVRANNENPTGIDHPWTLHDGPFKTGEANPHLCEDHPDTHNHYLFSC